MELNIPKRPARNRWLQPILLVIAALLGFIAATLTATRNTPVPLPPSPPEKPIVARGNLAEDEETTIGLFRKNAPSVVHITTKQNEREFLIDRITEGSGSGFVWDQAGHVVTNNHVVDDAFQAHVVLADGSVWPAELVGRAPSKDLAVLRIDAPTESLTPIQVGTSNDLQVGQRAFAIGNPFGLDRTLTTGVISALDRQIEAYQDDHGTEATRTIEGAIQTDAAINPGNSGGPILDSAGRLIGVSTSIFSPSGANAGVGFAIPVDVVRRFVPQLIKHGRIVRPSIGIQLATDSLLKSTSDREIAGVLIRHVRPTSRASRAGLRPTRITVGRRGDSHVQFGDLIVQANDTIIDDLNDWYSFLESKRPGDRINLRVVRGLFSAAESELQVQLTLDSTE
ncbi:S1C family serine protease [Planctomycetota bacterium]